MPDEHISERDLLSYNKKHARIRGSDVLKYPLLGSACKTECGLGDDKSSRDRSHRCVLAMGHAGEHEWSSECRGMDWRWRNESN